MYLLRFFPFLSPANAVLLDSFLLIIVILPALYLFLYRPLTEEIDKRKEAEEKLRTLALLDELTGLYNRRGFFSFGEQLLKLANRTKRGLTLIFADLDNLKWINDYHGHNTGDKSLRCMATVLKDTFRGSDVLGRLGGDEFVVLALEAGQDKIDLLRKRLQKSLKVAECKKHIQCSVSLSFGIAYYNPEKPCSLEELIKKADLLMYEEKRTSGSSVF
jgi:diguanylate cyclase (GGDEF)-like protein